MRIKRVVTAMAGLGLSVGIAIATPGTAQAASQVGWTGPAGTSHLTNSTIINSPNLVAESKIWQTFGAEDAPGTIGVRPRLFKSGVLCEAIDYVYNTNAATQLVVGTTATCGSGSYNSHGFVAVWNPTNFTFDQSVTFPSNPLNWTAPAARNANTPETAAVTSGTNANGDSYGSAAKAESDADIPDLVQAYATNGKVGYIKSADLNGPTATSPAEAVTLTSGPRTVNVYDKEGSQVIGQFTFGD
ncbi:hypothetical protein KXR83_25830 [Williamsia muralis]|uniref:hypothetical protein n=1 Tax=Williamsia marianensis TaxID=85044 RepID=UPI003F175F4C